MRTTPLALCLVALLLSACELPSGSRPEEEDMTAITGLEALDMQVLWPIVIKEVGESGFILDRDKTSQITGEFETRWRLELAPYRYEGLRKKVLGVVREMPEGSKEFTIRLTVWSQRNADIEDPMDPSQAIWQDIDPDQATSDEILYRIRRHFPDFKGKAEGGETR